MLKFIFLQSCLLLFFLSCTQQGKTPTKLEISIANFTSDLGPKAAGGVYLYAFGPNGRKFGKIVSTLDYSETLPNGAWSFYAVAWDGQVGTELNLNLSGVARCGAMKGVNLTGKAVNLNLTLTKTNCGSADFTNGVSMASTVMSGVTTTYFPRFMVEICKAIPADAGILDIHGCSYDLETQTDPKNKGYLGSIKVAVESFEQYPGSSPVFENDEIHSRCFPIAQTARGSIKETMTTGNGSTIVDFAWGLNLPVGNPNAPFPFKILGYYASADCNAGIESMPKEYTLMNGRRESTYNVVGNIFGATTTGGQSSGKIFLQTPATEVCEGALGSSDLTYAGGLGTKGHPYLICNPNQFNLARTSVLNSSVASFKLMSDLDFIFTFYPLYPIGDDPQNNSFVNFSGTFDGDYHKIKNLIYQKNNSTGLDEAKIGLIRHMVGATVANLILENVSVECHVNSSSGSCNSVGLIAGSATESKFSNILINRGHVAGVGEVGGVVGTVLDGGTGTPQSTFSGIHALGIIDVDCDQDITTTNYLCQNVGGLVGSAVKASFQNSSAKVSIHGDKGTMNVGGIVGVASNISMDAIFSSAQLSGKDAVGGLIGIANDASVITNSYSFASVRGDDKNATTPQAKAGGLVGIANSLALSNSFHSVGRVDTTADSPETTRALIGMVGANVTCTNSFAKSESTFSTGTCSHKSYSELKAAGTYNTSANSTTPVVDSDSFATTSSASFISLDNGYDYPHLKWELNQLSFFGFEIPYISTACFYKINNSTPSGLGSEASPFEICNINQLTGSAWSDSSHYFKLMRDLDFEDSSPGYLGFNHVMSAQFDGNFHSFKNIRMNLATQKALFESIASGAEIKNLDLEETRMAPGANSIDANATERVAILALENSGKISKVNLYGVDINTSNLNFTPGDGTGNDYTVKIGGLVAHNNTSGMIEDVEIDMQLRFVNPVSVNSTYQNILADMDQVWVGGIAGINEGSIDGVKSRFRYAYSYNNSNANFTLDQETDSLKMGSIVGENLIETATINKVEGSPEFRIKNNITMMTGSAGDIKIGGLIGENLGLLHNSFLTDARFDIDIGDYTNNGVSTFGSYIGGLVGKNRGMADLNSSYSSINEFVIGVVDYSGGLVGFNEQVNISPGNIFCVIPTGSTSNYFGGTSTSLNPSCILETDLSVSLNASNAIQIANTTSTLNWSYTLDHIDRTGMDTTPWLLESKGTYSYDLPHLRKTQKWFEDIH